LFRQPAAASRPERFSAELAAFGLGAAQIETVIARASAAPQEVEVFAWLATSLRWFLAMSSQWRRDAEGRPRALDYGCAEAVARLEGLSVTPDDFAFLRILERAAMDEMRARTPRSGRAAR
jgi:hypothetical protein